MEKNLRTDEKRRSKLMVTKINLAIDGPAGSGKTTIGKLLAEKLDYYFLDSGLLYRHFAFFCQQKDSSLENREYEKLLGE
jgi:cytidylate kinase